MSCSLVSFVSLFQAAKDELEPVYGVQEWGVTQSSLEEVFVNIVKQTGGVGLIDEEEDRPQDPSAVAKSAAV